MAAKKGGLGRGLDSLFGDSAVLQTPTPVSPAAAQKPEAAALPKAPQPDREIERVVYIKLNDIKPNASQPRKFFDESALADLASSIKEHGVIQPILVRPASKGYELVAGERRWRAARLAGLKEIPAIVRNLDERTNTLYALIENMQREDLNAIEEAEGIKEIIDRYGLTQEETAKVIGKSRPYVSNALRLLKLPEEILELVKNGNLSQGHARALAGLEDVKLQLDAARKAVEEGWSVRQIENYSSVKAAKPSAKKKAAKAAKDAETRDLEDRLSKRLGTRVSISGGAKSGKIIIEYYSEEELERVLEALS